MNTLRIYTKNCEREEGWLRVVCPVSNEYCEALDSFCVKLAQIRENKTGVNQMQFWKQIKKNTFRKRKDNYSGRRFYLDEKAAEYQRPALLEYTGVEPVASTMRMLRAPTALIPHNGNNGARTHDLPLVRRALSQLSYVSISCN